MTFRRSAVLGVVSSVVSGAALFLVFRIGIVMVGATLVGTWVMIQSVFLLARLPEAGVGLNITRLVRVDCRGGHVGTWSYLAAGLLLSVIPILLLGLVLLEPAVWLLESYFRSPVDVATLRLLAGLSLVTAVAGCAAAVLHSIVEGLGGLAWRHCATIAANMVMSASIYPLVKAYGVAGIGLAYCTQTFFLCLCGLLLLLWRRGRHWWAEVGAMAQEIPETSSPVGIARRLWRQNFVVSGMTLIGMSYEPWTKFIVTSADGLAAVAYLDLAIRVTTQIRVAIQAASQPLLSFGARQEQDQTEVHPGFDRAHQLVTKTNLFLISLHIVAAPFLSFVGLGGIYPQFIIFYIILGIGNAINSMGVVGYYFDASGGNLKRIFNINLGMMILNLILGGFGMLLFGSIGAVIGYALTFAWGGVALAGSWMAASRRRWPHELRGEVGAIIQAAFAVGAVALVLGGFVSHFSDLAIAGVSAFISTILLASFVQRHWRAYV